MSQGVIKKLVSDKGFGFISRDDGNDLFFHRSAVEGVDFDTLREGQNVEFTVGSGPKGPAAESVRVV
ncbi:MAG: cold-shock protein [Rubripirellula sp.]